MQLLEAIRQYVAPLREQIAAYPASGRDMSAWFRDCVMRPLLPVRYGLRSGMVFDNEGTQTDFPLPMIVDTSYALPLGERIAVESVYAVYDVLPVLDDVSLREALLKIQRIKTLRREKATAYDVSPVHHLRMFGARYAQMTDDQLNPYLGYVFSLDGDGGAVMPTIDDMITARALKPEFTPNAIVGLRGGWLVTRQTRTGEMSVPRSSFAKFGMLQLGDDLLPTLYTLLNASLAQIQLRAPDLLPLLSQLRDSARHG
jgi:hypothetical protein